MTYFLDPSFTKDDLIIRFGPVVFDAGAAVQSLDGAVIEAVLRGENGQVATGGAAAVIITPTLEEYIDAVWPNDTLTPGIYAGQIRVSKAGQTQTVREFTIPVIQSF